MKFKITEQTDSRLDHFLVSSTSINRNYYTYQRWVCHGEWINY